MLDADYERFVFPFYLTMMATNATANGDELVHEIAALAREISVGDILELLQSGWRTRVMGAWFAAARDETEIGDAVLISLDTCLGSLTSPPLVTAALLHGRPDTMQCLRSYVERDTRSEWGASGFALAGIAHLGGVIENGTVTEADHRDLAAMLDLARRLRDA